MIKMGQKKGTSNSNPKLSKLLLSKLNNCYNLNKNHPNNIQMKKMMKSENIQNQSRIIIIIINSLIQNNYKKCKAKNQLRDKVAK